MIFSSSTIQNIYITFQNYSGFWVFRIQYFISVGVFKSSAWGFRGRLWRALLSSVHLIVLPSEGPSVRIVALPAASFFFHLPCPYSWSVVTSALFASSLLLDCSYLRTPMRNWWEIFYICSWSCSHCWSPGWNSEITWTSFVFGKTRCLSHEWKVFAGHQIKIFKSVSGVLLEELKK